MDSNEPDNQPRAPQLPALPTGLEGFAFQTRWGPLPLPSALRPEDRGDPLMDPLTMNQLWRVALVYAASKVVPGHFQGKPDDVYIVLRMARRYGLDEHELLQNLYVVNGRPSWLTEFLVARARSKGIDIRWKRERQTGTLKVQGKLVAEMAVTAYVWKDEDADRQVTFTTQDAIDLGWSKSEQYHSTAGMENMLMWRSAARLIARYFSDIKHGLPAAEDVQTIGTGDEHVVAKPEVQRGAAGLAAKLGRPGVFELDMPAEDTAALVALVNKPEPEVDPKVVRQAPTSTDDRPGIYEKVHRFEALLGEKIRDEVRATIDPQLRRVSARSPRPLLLALLAAYEARWSPPAADPPAATDAPTSAVEPAQGPTLLEQLHTLRGAFGAKGEEAAAVFDEVIREIIGTGARYEDAGEWLDSMLETLVGELRAELEGL